MADDVVLEHLHGHRQPEAFVDSRRTHAPPALPTWLPMTSFPTRRFPPVNRLQTAGSPARVRKNLRSGHSVKTPCGIRCLLSPHSFMAVSASTVALRGSPVKTAISPTTSPSRKRAKLQVLSPLSSFTETRSPLDDVEHVPHIPLGKQSLPGTQGLELEAVEQMTDSMLRNGIQDLGVEQKCQVINLWEWIVYEPRLGKGLDPHRGIKLSTPLNKGHRLHPCETIPGRAKKALNSLFAISSVRRTSLENPFEVVGRFYQGTLFGNVQDVDVKSR